MTIIGAVAVAGAVVAGQATPAGAVLPIPLQQGTSGSAVRLWQQDLNFVIHREQTCRPTLMVDGQFGSITARATRCFQKLSGVTPDEIVGKDTRDAMCLYLVFFEGGTLFEKTCT